MTRIAPICALFAGTLLLAGSHVDQGVAPLIVAVENRYNRAQSLKLDFTEAYAAPRRPVQNEAGTLWLRKPGKMRWEYREPSGKLFLSDGKDVYLYVPADKRATRSKLKESEDMRAPLAFLLGKLNFEKEFRNLSLKAAGGSTWIVAEPKSENLAYTKVEFLTLASGEIQGVRVTGQDGSHLEFTFSNETLNPQVPASKFVFAPPAGVEIVTEAQD